MLPSSALSFPFLRYPLHFSKVNRVEARVEVAVVAGPALRIAVALELGLCVFIFVEGTAPGAFLFLEGPGTVLGAAFSGWTEKLDMPGRLSFVGLEGTGFIEDDCAAAVEFEERRVLEPDDFSVSPMASGAEGVMG